MITKTVFTGKEARTKVIGTEEVDLEGTKELTWINCIGLKRDDIKQIIKENRDIPDFLIEDCTTNQIPRLDNFDKIVSIIFKILEYNQKIEINQVNVILGRKYLLTFFRKDSEYVSKIRDIVGEDIHKIHKFGIGHLLYLFLDTIEESYHPTLDKIDDGLDKLEKGVLKPNKETLHKILKLKEATLILKKNIYPEREILRLLGENRVKMINENNGVYFRDLNNDLLQTIELVSNQREILSSSMEIYLSSLSNNMNEVMKVLTVIASLVLVPTLVSGIYGMNFEFLPLSSNPQGFYLTLGLMLLIIIIMSLFFKRKGWI